MSKIEMSRIDQMAVDEIPRLLLRFALPAIIGLLVNALYNIVDSIFVGRGVGDLALAGVTVSFPIVTILMACVMFIGMGATALISLRLGEQKESEAERIMGNALTLFVLIGLGMSMVGLLFLNSTLTLFGASEKVLPYALDYMKIILPGSVLMAIGVGMNSFIRAEGNPKTAMNTMLIGTVTNIILDYIFIFVFHWGVKGAAFATVISYGVTSTWVLYHFLAGGSVLKVKFKNLKLKGSVIKSIIVVGFPTFVLQVTNSIQQLILNRSLVHHGGDMALAVIGIIMSIVMFVVMPAIGISQGAQPIIGYNYGAKQLKRVKDTLKLSLISATAVITVGFAISMVWPAQLIGLFNTKPELIELGAHAMKIFFKFLPLVGLQIISSSYFQAVGKPNQATLLSLSRQVIIFIPLLLILPRFWGLEGIWWSAPISDAAAFILTGIWLWHEIKQLGETEISNEKTTQQTIS